MTKIYKSISAADEGEQRELIAEARVLFSNFHDGFYEWVHQRVLGPQKDDSGQLDKRVREKAWNALNAINGLFPQQDEALLLAPVVEKNIQRYQRAFVETFKVIEKYLSSQEAEGKTPAQSRYEKHVVSGIQVLIDNFGREGGAEMERDIDDFLKRLGAFAQRIVSAGFGSAVKGLTLHVAFAQSHTLQHPGLVAGIYSAVSDSMEVYPLGFVGSNGETFTHEVGHRFWHRDLAPRARAWWNEVFEKRAQAIDSADVEGFVSGYLATHLEMRPTKLEKLVEREEADPLKRSKYVALAKICQGPRGEPFRNADLSGRRQWLLDKGVGIKVYVEKISDYATESPSEAFAEAFRVYIVQGPAALGEWTRWFFKEISRSGGAKLAAQRVAECYVGLRGA